VAHQRPDDPEAAADYLSPIVPIKALPHVGYGTQSIRPRFLSQVVRYQGVSSLVNLVNAQADGFLNCKRVAYSYRVDIATSLDFLAGFGVTPSTP
jgi:hypothetical protein